MQTADGAEGSGPWAGEGAGSPGTHGAEAGPNTETESARAEVERPGYFVHICGQVKEPGVYELPEGSRVYEAVEAAGGFTEEAAAEALNLAEKITVGMKYMTGKRPGPWKHPGRLKAEVRDPAGL